METKQSLVNPGITIEKVTARMENKRSGEPNRENPKIYFWPKGEGVMDNLINRRNRPYEAWKELIPEVIEMLKESDPEAYEYLSNPVIKWGWSKNCGCSMCPCSPGFIGTDPSRSYSKFYPRPYTLHVTVSKTLLQIPNHED